MSVSVCRWEEARSGVENHGCGGKEKRMTAPGGSQGPLLDDPGGYEEPLPTLGSWAKQRRTSGHRTACRTALDSCMGGKR